MQSVSGIQATEIHTNAVRMRSRSVKALDAASLAEKMFGLPGPEAIRRQSFIAPEKKEVFFRNDQMEITRFRADRAVAVEQRRLFGNLSLEADGAAMTTARNLHSTVTDLARLRG